MHCLVEAQPRTETHAGERAELYGDVGDDELQAVLRQDADPRTDCQASMMQPRRDAPSLVIQLAVGEPALTLYHRDAVSVVATRLHQ
jgi:hypothetical protein